MSKLLQRYFKLNVAILSLLHLLLVIIAPTVTSQNEHLMPEFCVKKKPRNDMEGCETERRWFVHETKGCKPFAICTHQTGQLDVQTGINYFTSKEKCQATCTKGIVCPELSAPENGNVTGNSVMSWGDDVTYSCNEGYSLEGKKKRTCQRTATWSLTAPSCEKQCSPPPSINHSTIAPVHNFYNKDTRIFYTCDEGYSSAVTERTCESGGVWSGPEPVCESLQKRYCPEPDLIHNGMIYAPDRAVGDTVTYWCDDGFILIGNATRVCGDDEHWQGDAPVCWKLSLEYFTEDSTTMERMDITNKTLTLPADTRNVWIMTGSSHPDPLKDSIPIWLFNNDVLREMEHPHGVEQHEHKLKFPRILESKEQEGNYTIKISRYSVSFRLVVDNEAPPPTMSVAKPELVVMPVTKQSNLGEDASFSCVFIGCPSPNVTWFRDDTLLLPGGRVEYELYIQHRITVCHLTIKNVSEADKGLYKCVGDNPGGNASSDFVDLVLNSDTEVVLQRRRRSTDETEQQSSLCKWTSDPESVTLVATASKELRRPRSSRQLRNYRFEVRKILKGHLGSLSLPNGRNKRSLRAVVLDSNIDQTTTTTHLLADTQYILNGRMVDDILYISGPQSIHQYSKQLEAHIQSC